MWAESVIVPQPEINKDIYADFTFQYYEAWLKMLRRALNRNIFNPESHPAALDLYAGDGSAAWLMNQLGYSPKQITCIDVAEPKNPLVKGVEWKFFNLEALGLALITQERLPEIVDQMREQFDLALIFYAPGLLRADLLTAFFVKPNGLLYYHLGGNDFENSPFWEEIKQPYFHRRTDHPI